MNVIDDADGPLDPRIQIELESLNNATDNINKLEIELDDANTAYKQLLSDTGRRSDEIKCKLGNSCIEKSRCYFQALKVVEEARKQCQKQAKLFSGANEIHAAAKETVALAESRFMSHQHEWNFDEAWQDMLSHATIKVMDAENQKAACAREHHRRKMLFEEAERKVQELEEKYRRSINKARPFFEMTAECDKMLVTQKQRVEELQKKVKEAKNAYAASLRTLEEISNQIHERRRDYDIVANGPREPGVGAELITPEESLNYEAELNKIKISRINSIASSDPDLDDREKDFDDVLELKQRVESLGGRSVDGMESTSSQWELELQASMKKLNEISLGKGNNNFTDDNNEALDKLSTLEKLTKNNDNELVKFDSQPATRFSLNYQGWQSLAQSPINSIFNKSKDALKNSISKSLSNSPVNMKQFTFSRAKLERQQSVDKSTITNDDDDNNKESQNITNSSNLQLVEKKLPSNIIDDNDEKLQKNSSHVDSEKKSQHTDNNSRTEKSDIKKVQITPTMVDKNFTTHSLSSSPVKRNYLFNSKSTKSLDINRELSLNANEEFKKPNCPSKELPLLSIFRNSFGMSKDKSCSMIDLGDKQNLKGLFENSSNKNLQTVSVERLANARHKLMCTDNCELKITQ
ncbi:SH3 domain-binding protein 5 homolog [Leptopilina heterotoma]|uniref:SH3 domain-binding protein 5 homolog n=1 Tax=Leptopilina heterotoma TaxID=63436 RepID=UPI001CA98D5E|nr:SH3 domain-binding protein 5 homolog [Leptopilina heterotoma]